MTTFTGFGGCEPLEGYILLVARRFAERNFSGLKFRICIQKSNWFAKGVRAVLNISRRITYHGCRPLLSSRVVVGWVGLHRLVGGPVGGFVGGLVAGWVVHLGDQGDPLWTLHVLERSTPVTCATAYVSERSTVDGLRLRTVHLGDQGDPLRTVHVVERSTPVTCAMADVSERSVLDGLRLRTVHLGDHGDPLASPVSKLAPVVSPIGSDGRFLPHLQEGRKRIVWRCGKKRPPEPIRETTGANLLTGERQCTEDAPKSTPDASPVRKFVPVVCSIGSDGRFLPHLQKTHLL